MQRPIAPTPAQIIFDVVLRARDSCDPAGRSSAVCSEAGISRVREVLAYMMDVVQARGEVVVASGVTRAVFGDSHEQVSK